MKHNLILSLILIITQVTFAADECPRPVTKLEKGAVSPCLGYLFSPETELDARTAVQTKDKLKEYMDIQKDIIKTQEDRINNQFAQLQTLQDNALKQERTTTLMNAVYFGVGVLVTGLIAVNVGK